MREFNNKKENSQMNKLCSDTDFFNKVDSILHKKKMIPLLESHN